MSPCLILFLMGFSFICSLFKVMDKVFFVMVMTMVFVFLKFFNNPSLNFGFIYIDTVSFVLLEMLLFVCIICFMFIQFNKLKKFILFLILIFLFFFFSSQNILAFFIFFELSLVPIFILIIGFGFQPERVLAGQYLMIYTLLGSVPLLIGFMSLILEGMFSLNLLIFFRLHESSFFYLFSFILAFLIKVPMFLFHSWLPKAHVEAPLEGSMILASLMLKMGVFGLLRFLPSVCKTLYGSFSLDILFSISIMGSIYSLLIALSVDDVKMTVAYSSVAHMNFLVVNLLTFKNLAFYSSIVMSLSHGMCSMMLFYLMTFMYLKYNSRSILISKGFFSYIPAFMLANFLSWSLNMSAPPSINFLSELLMISCISSISSVGLILSMFYILLNSFYSLLNFGLQTHCSWKVLIKNIYFEVFYLFIMFSCLFPLIIFFFFLDFLV